MVVNELGIAAVIGAGALLRGIVRAQQGRFDGLTWLIFILAAETVLILGSLQITWLPYWNRFIPLLEKAKAILLPLCIAAVVIGIVLVILALLAGPDAKPGPIQYVISGSESDARPGEQWLSPYDRATGDRIMDLAALAEARQFGRNLGRPVEVRVIKPPLLDYDSDLNYTWLLVNGPSSDVRIIETGGNND